MSVQAAELRPVARTNSGSVIVYDPERQTLSIWKRKKLDSMTASKHVLVTTAI